MNEVIEKAIKDLIGNHRIEFDELVYTRMKESGLLTTAPFSSTAIDIGRQESSYDQAWMGGL